MKKKSDSNKKFLILYLPSENISGLLYLYFISIGCVNHYISKGYIPIIDLISHPNVYNKFNINLSYNPWEKFFYQPYNHTLDNVKKNSKRIEYKKISVLKNEPNFSIELFYNNRIRLFWHNKAKKYIPIKKEIINEANYIFKKLFQDSINILGILIRGTDYIAKKPFLHAIPPTPEMVFKDIEIMDKKYKYNWFFITTEDELIREKFIHKYGKKLKYFKSRFNLKYDYKKKEYLSLTKIIFKIN